MLNGTVNGGQCQTDYTAKASEALLDILKVAVYNQIENEGSRACLGKHLCQSKMTHIIISTYAIIIIIYLKIYNLSDNDRISDNDNLSDNIMY